MAAVGVSVLIPVYNEANSIRAVLQRIAEVAASTLSPNVSLELIVVDDASSDQSAAMVREFAREHTELPVRLIVHTVNQGKGTAIRVALEKARGEFSVIQDADLEYDPAEYPKLLRPLLDGDADFVMGSRFLSTQERRVFRYHSATANRLITRLAALASGLDLTDVETGYKAFRTSLAQTIPLRSNRFGLDPELTIKLIQRHARVFEVPISYRGRTEEEGKKIRARDALAAIAVILRARLANDAYKDRGAAMLGQMASARRFNGWMAAQITPFLGQRILEFGAGIGNMTLILSKDRRQYVATDPDPLALVQLRSRIAYRPNVAVAQCDLLNEAELEQFRDSMDTVVCLNVLEHIGDDDQALLNLRNCLSPGGRAIVLVPQDPRLYGSLDMVLEHKRRYTEAGIREKMAAAGFRIEHVIPFNRVTYPGWFFNSKVLRRRTLSSTQLRLVDVLVPLWRRIDGLLPWPSNSLIVIGVRQDS